MNTNIRANNHTTLCVNSYYYLRHYQSNMANDIFKVKMFAAWDSHPHVCFAMPWVSKLWITVYIHYWRHVFIKTFFFCEILWILFLLYRPGVGVTKAPFVNFSVSKIFDNAKVPVRIFVSHSYLTGVTATELRQHLSNMNMIFNS